MKLLVITAAAVLAVTAASAQPDVHRGNRAYLRSATAHACQGAPLQGGNRPGHPSAGAGGGRPGGGQPGGSGPPGGGPGHGGRPAGGGSSARPPGGGGAQGGGSAGPGNKPGGGTPGLSRPSGQSPRNFDRRAYQRNWDASRRYSAGIYRRPAGWYYRRWAFGQTLPALFRARDYWLSSWWQYGLMTPPYGYQWVRYGDDAILVDTTTGQILQAQYGVFY